MKADKDSDLSGKKVGEYDVLGRLGVGGMGVVYEGLHPLIGKRVAIKVLLPHLSSEPELVSRFLSEARAVNAIGHRGIVDIFSFGELNEGRHYFVMEYLEGTSFDRLLKDRGPLPVYEVLNWMSEVLDALQAAHTAGIIHRDIKPSNLFLVHSKRANPYVKLLDFGIAKLGSALGESTPQTRASMLIGTPDYMSPEQARGKPIGPATDLYALGCVMFELLTGERLFKGENPMQTMFMHVENEPRRVSELLLGAMPELDALVARTLEKDPAKRPTSATELRDEVERLIDLLPNERQVSGGFAATIVRPGGGKGTPPPISSGSRPRRNRSATPAGTTRYGTPATSTLDKVEPVDRTEIREAPAARTVAAAATSTEPVRAPAPASSNRWMIFAGLGALAVAGVAIGWSTSHKPEVARPVAVVEEIEDAKPVEGVRPDEVRKATEVAKPVEVAKPGEVMKPGEVAKPGETTKPGEVVKSIETTKAAAVAKPGEVTTPAETTKPAEVKKPVEAKPAKSKVPTQPELEARLAKLGATLKAREEKSGLRDSVLHQFLDQGQKVVQQATTDPDRLKAARFLVDFEKQLGAAR